MATFEYDALGRRIEKVVGTSTTRFYYDDQRIALQTSVSGEIETDWKYFVYGNYIDEVLLMRNLSGSNLGDYYYAHDHLYSPTVLFGLNEQQSWVPVERYEYDVYGACRILDSNFGIRASSLYGNPYVFTGRELDSFDCTPPAVGCTLYYYRARSYDPQTGRFLQRDPLGVDPADIFLPRIQYLDGNNIYEYCESNVVVFIDPTGLFCQVFYSCGLVGESELGTFTKQCTYKCAENKKKHREQSRFGSLMCDDSRIPTVLDYSDSVLKCSKCPKTQDYTKIWREGEFPDPIGCSRSACIEGSKLAKESMDWACRLLKGGQKVACKIAAEVAYKAMLDACDLCSKP